MKRLTQYWRERDVAEYLGVLARLCLGATFFWMGWNKALHPAEFLKLLRQYEMTESHVLLNFIAAVLPWHEVLCGLLLVSGVAVRGAALVSLLMLVPFTLAVAVRAHALHVGQAIPFCAIKFDCGCGNGEVLICRKILENAALMGLAAVLMAGVGCRKLSLSHAFAVRRSGSSGIK